MRKPAPKFKPKKVSAVEPETLQYQSFKNLDEMPSMYGAHYEKWDLENLPIAELPMKVIEMPEPEPVVEELPKVDKKEKKKQKKLKKRKSSRIVKTVTERIEEASEKEDSSDEGGETNTSKARANHLPPVEILFAHLERVDTMRSKVVEPIMQESMKKAPPKK